MSDELSNKELLDEVFSLHEIKLKKLEEYTKKSDEAIERGDYKNSKWYNLLAGYYFLELISYSHLHLSHLLNDIKKDEKFEELFHKRFNEMKERDNEAFIKADEVDSKILKLKKAANKSNSKDSVKSKELILIVKAYEVLNKMNKEADEAFKEKELLKKIKEFYGEDTFKRIEENSEVGYI